MSAAKALADRMIAEEDAAYRKELAELEAYYRAHPPLPPVGKYEPPRKRRLWRSNGGSRGSLGWSVWNSQV